MENRIVQGTVIHGRGLGHTVDMATANLDYDKDNFKIDSGVYATKVKIIRLCMDGNVEFEDKYGVTNVGTKPTVDDDENISIETHIIDFDDIIYGYTLHVEFVKRIRDIEKFSDLNVLKAQVDKDIEEARKIFSI